MLEVKTASATLLLVRALSPPPSLHLPSSRGELILDPKMCKEVFHNDQMVLSLEDNCLIFAIFYLSQNRLFSFTAQREIMKEWNYFQDKINLTNLTSVRLSVHLCGYRLNLNRVNYLDIVHLTRKILSISYGEALQARMKPAFGR